MEIFQGDSFQILFSNPRRSLASAIFFRSRIRCLWDKKKGDAPDARISIGLSELPDQGSSLLESNGVAFHLSGRNIDSLRRKKQRLGIYTENPKETEVLKLIALTSDSIVSRWSFTQARIAGEYLLTKNPQINLATKFGVNQSTIQRTLKAANFELLEAHIDFFESHFTA